MGEGGRQVREPYEREREIEVRRERGREVGGRRKRERRERERELSERGEKGKNWEGIGRERRKKSRGRKGRGVKNGQRYVLVSLTKEKGGERGGRRRGKVEANRERAGNGESRE